MFRDLVVVAPARFFLAVQVQPTFGWGYWRQKADERLGDPPLKVSRRI